MYTVRLETARIKRMLRFKSECGIGSGSGAHTIIARVRAKVGANKNRTWDDDDGRIGSLVNNFTPSAIGWSSPKGPIILGPLRCCI